MMLLLSTYCCYYCRVFVIDDVLFCCCCRRFVFVAVVVVVVIAAAAAATYLGYRVDEATVRDVGVEPLNGLKERHPRWKLLQEFDVARLHFFVHGNRHGT